MQDLIIKIILATSKHNKKGRVSSKKGPFALFLSLFKKSCSSKCLSDPRGFFNSFSLKIGRSRFYSKGSSEFGLTLLAFYSKSDSKF